MLCGRIQAACLQSYTKRPFLCIVHWFSNVKAHKGYQTSSSFVPPSLCNLGVWEACVVKYPTVLDSISQLPEVERSIHSFHSQKKKSERDSALVSVLDAIDRSIQIFGSIQAGSKHVASLALLAEIQFQCNMQIACYETLQNVHELCANNGTVDGLRLVDSIRLAQAKAHWLNGEHEEASSICTSLIDEEATPLTIKIAARTGQALSRLVQVSSLDDAFSVRDPFRGVVKLLERSVVSSTTKVAAYLNMGVAEAVYAENVARHHDIDVPLDGAMRAWKLGLTELKRDNRTTAPALQLRLLLQSRLQANMAWGMLQMPREADHVERARTFASESLATRDGLSKLSDPINLLSTEGLCRTLSVLAACYHRSGGAVTAQGLFQSAIDHDPLVHHVLPSLERRDALELYSKLFLEWEKREGDAARLQQQANDLNASLPDRWRGKSAVHGSLWFWTPEYCR